MQQSRISAAFSPTRFQQLPVFVGSIAPPSLHRLHTHIWRVGAGALLLHYLHAPKVVALCSLSAAWKCKECERGAQIHPLVWLVARRRRLSRRLARSCTLLAIITRSFNRSRHTFKRNRPLYLLWGANISPPCWEEWSGVCQVSAKFLACQFTPPKWSPPRTMEPFLLAEGITLEIDPIKLRTLLTLKCVRTIWMQFVFYFLLKIQIKQKLTALIFWTVFAAAFIVINNC